MTPIILSTTRLVLRRANEEDTENLFQKYFSDSYSSYFLTRKPHIHIDQTRKFLNEWCNTYWDNASNKFAWVIALVDTDEAIGVFLVEQGDANSVQIHYGIANHFSRQGFTTEAGNAVVQWLMGQTDMRKIWAVCDLSNEGSIKVLEKLGFKREKILENWLIFPSINNLPRDCYMYSYINTYT